MKIAIAFLALSALLFGCKQQQNGTNNSQTVTQTIAPAEAKPTPGSGTDAMTQTVDLGDGRSEAEGGTAETAPPTDTAAKKPAAVKKKHK